MKTNHTPAKTNLPVTPPGIEPRSSEPESDILSIKLWGLSNLTKIIKIGIEI